MDLRSLQKPLKEQYRSDPNASQIRIRAKGGQTDVPVACSVDIGRAIYHAEAHKGVGGGGTGACSGDLLLGALAACAQITCQMVARSEEHTSELQSRGHLVCRLLLEKKKKHNKKQNNEKKNNKYTLDTLIIHVYICYVVSSQHIL